MKNVLAVLTVLGLMAQGVVAQDATTDIWETFAKYKMGDAPNPPPTAIETLVTGTPLAERGPIEDKLIGIITSTDATPEAKWFSCRLLQRIGTEKCLPTLAPLLTDPIMSHYARLTLERFPDSEDAGKALVAALKDAPDDVKVGLLGSLGERGYEKGVKAIAKLTQSEHAAVATAALEALGEIGGKRALSAITKAKCPEAAMNARWDAMLSVASDLQNSKVLEDIYEDATSDAHRGAALRGLLLADDAKAASLIAERVKGDGSLSLRNAALTIAARDNGQRVSAALAEVLSDVPAERQPALITMLGNSGNPQVLSTIQNLITSDDDNVSSAAIRATAMLGDGNTAKALLITAQGPKKDIVIDAIAAMSSTDITSALTAALKDESVSAAACAALARREATEALPALKALASTGALDAQGAAWESLGVLASADDLDDLMKMVIAIKDGKVARYAKAGLLNVLSGAPDKQACSKIVGAYYDQADDATKMFILDFSAAGGGSEGIVHARKALTSGRSDLYDKAVRALAAWSEHQHAYNDLLAIAADAPEEKHRIIALRGYISHATKEGNKDQYLKRLSAAIPLAKRAEEKRLIIAAAGNRNEVDFVPIVRRYAEDAEVAAEARLSLLNKADHFIKSKLAPEGLIETLKLIVNDPASPADLIKRAQEKLTKLSG